MHFKRSLNLKKFNTSLFLFGPRLTGKTTLLKLLSFDEYFDLLDPELELEYRTNPKQFWQQISAMKKGSRIIVDEIQKVPILLNYVQKAIDQLGHKFILSGSSARKLKRGGANLLGGRALDLRLHPLTSEELGDNFSCDFSMQYGTLPRISDLISENNLDLAKQHLKSYISTYLKEEIQAEALTRNVGAFNRFLNIAAQSNGQFIEFSNISRECSVPASTVKEYYQILEDTLIGFFLWPDDRSERKKARPKFYFFDCGVLRSIQNRLNDPPTAIELGCLFETWFVNEILRLRDYLGKEHQFSFWRERDQEIDILISGGRGVILAIECKSGKVNKCPNAVNSFKKKFPKVPIIIASLQEPKAKLVGNVKVLPYKQAIDYYKNLK
ncbi:MAG: AAA family ATPase [Candidatus Omnitrophota bacterium]